MPTNAVNAATATAINYFAAGLRSSSNKFQAICRNTRKEELAMPTGP